MSDSGGYEEDRSWRRASTVILAAGIVLCAIIAWFVVLPAIPDDDDTPLVAAVPRTDPVADDAASATEPPSPAPASSTGTPRQTPTSPPATEGPAATEAPPATEAPVTTGEGEPAEVPETTVAPATTVAVTSEPVATEPPPTAPAAPATTAPTGPVTYDTLPDGSPAPVVAVFGADQITITGAVPTQAAKDRLQALAIANAKPGQDATIANFLTINPDVPIGVGVRVVETTSTRFPESSAEIFPPHAAELNRILAIMQALPNVTALVIGHADQRGGAASNYELSAQRADAVVRYLSLQGIEPSRLSSRAVGEAELLTLNDDDLALALNRRTEVVFYGLLVG